MENGGIKQHSFHLFLCGFSVTQEVCDQATMFDCGGGECISKAKVCNAIDNCANQKDEDPALCSK